MKESEKMSEADYNRAHAEMEKCKRELALLGDY